MITWMQRHKKYLIITIWISTITFVGAGFVGWGQYDYGEKAGSVAKVGDIEITMGDLQKSYSNLYNQYAQMFQGEFDEEKAKSFGLKSQALHYLIRQGLVLNLAKSYSLEITDAELLAHIKKQDYFFKDGSFDKELYKEVLSRNNLSVKEYEADVKKELLIQKTLDLLPVQAQDRESKIIDTAANIADKIEYKVLYAKDITVATSDTLLKPFWEKMKNDFMTETTYDVKYIKQPMISNEYEEKTLRKHYDENRLHFKDQKGKILSFEDAKDAVKEELNAKATKKEALRGYIAYKKGQTEDLEIQSATLSSSNNPFNQEALRAVADLSELSAFAKPIMVKDAYITFELIKKNEPQPKSFEQAKNEVLPLYVQKEKNTKLTELAKNTYATFKGKKTDYITANDALKLTSLQGDEANEFLSQLFVQQKRRGYVVLKSGNIVLYNILEQKLLEKSNSDQKDSIARMKDTMFQEGLIKNLKNKYKTEIFIEGL